VIKGEKLGYFGTTKGLDTLSPFIFILCVKDSPISRFKDYSL